MHVHASIQIVLELALQVCWESLTTIVHSSYSKRMLDLSETIANPHSLRDGKQLHDVTHSSSQDHSQSPSTNEHGFTLSQSNKYDYIPATLRRDIVTTRIDGKSAFSFKNNEAYSLNSRNEQEEIDDGLYEN